MDAQRRTERRHPTLYSLLFGNSGNISLSFWEVTLGRTHTKTGGKGGHYVKFGTGVSLSHPVPALFASIDPGARQQLQPATQPGPGAGAGGGDEQRRPQPQLPETKRVSTNGS